MEALIRQQVQDEDVDAVEEILLDEWKGTAISPQEKSLIETYANSLNLLSFAGSGLTSLSNFPALGALMKLDLSQNKISGGLDNLSRCAELIQLDLIDNQIRSIDSLSPLVNLPNLLSLELHGNPVTEVEGYREKVFEICRSLEVLDGLNVEGQEVSLSEEGSDDDFSIDSDFDDPEEEEESEADDFDSEDEKPKRKRRGGDVEPRKHKK
jgi:hypothetical protein